MHGSASTKGWRLAVQSRREVVGVMEEEIGWLKLLVADLSVQKQILKEVNAKNGESVEEAVGDEAERGGRFGIGYSDWRPPSLLTERQNTWQ